MALPYPTKVVLPFDIATAQDMNERHANDVALAAGSGLDDGAIPADKIDFTTLNLGLTEKTTSFVANSPMGAGPIQIPGLSVTVTNPTSSVRKVRVHVYIPRVYSSSPDAVFINVGLHDGAVSSGNNIGGAWIYQEDPSRGNFILAEAYVDIAASATVTYNASTSLQTVGPNYTFFSSSENKSYIAVDIVR